MTIIGVVAVVLMILGFFLFQFIDKNFPNQNDQGEILKKLAVKVSSEAALHRQDDEYLGRLNELLKIQDASMVMLERSHPDRSVPILFNGEQSVLLTDIFELEQIESVFDGKIISRMFSGTVMDSLHNKFLILVHPIQDLRSSEITSALVLYQSLQSAEDTGLYVKKLFALVSFIGFLMTTFLAFFLITRLTRPLVKLKKAADVISQGDYSVRVPVVSSDEIGELTKAFNKMGEEFEETITDLNHGKENLSSVLRSMADAVISFDVEGNVIFMNPLGEMVLEEWRQIHWHDPEEERLSRQWNIPDPLHHLFEHAVQKTEEIHSKLSVNNGVWSVVMTPLYSREAVRGAVAVLRDVTEEQKLNKLRKDFVANVSHELRTPLSMLQGYSEALLDDIVGSPEERQELVQVIHDESLRMGRLVKDLLDLARMEAGHVELSLGEVNLVPLIKRVERKFSVLCKEQGIQFISHLEDQTLMLKQADEDRLEQVLTNLLDNAVRHSQSGTAIKLHAHRVMFKDQAMIQIIIADQGEGIPAEDLPFIFERFYKADKARTRGSSGGTGLGLAIVHNIVEAHQGIITADSKAGEGTKFTVLLPVQSFEIERV